MPMAMESPKKIQKGKKTHFGDKGLEWADASWMLYWVWTKELSSFVNPEA